MIKYVIVITSKGMGDAAKIIVYWIKYFTNIVYVIRNKYLVYIICTFIFLLYTHVLSWVPVIALAILFQNQNIEIKYKTIVMVTLRVCVVCLHGSVVHHCYCEPSITTASGTMLWPPPIYLSQPVYPHSIYCQLFFVLIRDGRTNVGQ